MPEPNASALRVWEPRSTCMHILALPPKAPVPLLPSLELTLPWAAGIVACEERVDTLRFCAVGARVIPGCARNVRDVRKLLHRLPEVACFEGALLEDRSSPHPGEAIGLQLLLDGEE